MRSRRTVLRSGRAVCIHASGAEPLLLHSLARVLLVRLVWPACWVGQLLACALFSVLTHYTVHICSFVTFLLELAWAAPKALLRREAKRVAVSTRS